MGLIRNQIQILFGSANARDQQIAANGLSTPQDAIAILLHRLVRPIVDRPVSTSHLLKRQRLIDTPVADHVSFRGPNHALAIDIRRKRGVHHI
jgi:hypothetical protein